MTDFQPALDFMLAHEGGYSFHEADPGGETFKGISRRAWPHWDGWTMIDSLKGEQDFTALLENEDLSNLVTKFYATHFWHQMFPFIQSQPLVNKLFDATVNIGPDSAVRKFQEAINAAGGRVAVDGVIGLQTVEAANTLEVEKPEAVLREFRATLAMRYVSLVIADQNKKVFLKGWIHRAVA